MFFLGRDGEIGERLGEKMGGEREVKRGGHKVGFSERSEDVAIFLCSRYFGHGSHYKRTVLLTCFSFF